MKPLRKRLKGLLDHVLQERGFSGKFPYYRRKRSQSLDLLHVQFDRHGEDRFVIEIGSLPRGDFQTSWGEAIPEEKLDVGYLDYRSRLRLGARAQGHDHWFKLDAGDLMGQVAMIGKLLDEQGERFFNRIRPAGAAQADQDFTKKV